MIEKTASEFRPGEFIAFYETSVDGVKYLARVSKINFIRVEEDNLGMVIFALHDVDFSQRPKTFMDVRYYPLVKQYNNTPPTEWIFSDNFLMKEVSTAELEKLFEKAHKNVIS